jgi:hypothetical protein
MRRVEILRGSGFWLSAVAGVVVGLLAPHFASDTKLGDALTIVLAYAAIAFGFSVAGLTVALTLPDEDFVHDLATREPEARSFARCHVSPTHTVIFCSSTPGQRYSTGS